MIPGHQLLVVYTRAVMVSPTVPLGALGQEGLCAVLGGALYLTVLGQMVLRQDHPYHYTNPAQVTEVDCSAEFCLVTHQGEIESNSQIFALHCVKFKYCFFKPLPPSSRK